MIEGKQLGDGGKTLGRLLVPGLGAVHACLQHRLLSSFLLYRRRAGYRQGSRTAAETGRHQVGEEKAIRPVAGQGKRSYVHFQRQLWRFIEGILRQRVGASHELGPETSKVWGN